METILAHKTASLTEFRDPAKVMREAGGETVAIMNRSNIIGYFVPQERVGKQAFKYVDSAEAEEMVDLLCKKHKKILDYLKDK